MARRYGLGTGTPTPIASELHAAGRPGLDQVASGQWWTPSSPLFWLGGILLATVGLAAVSGSGSAKLGPLHASASAGVGK
jgi:hypothetical protein